MRFLFFAADGVNWTIPRADRASSAVFRHNLVVDHGFTRERRANLVDDMGSKFIFEMAE